MEPRTEALMETLTVPRCIDFRIPGFCVRLSGFAKLLAPHPASAYRFLLGEKDVQIIFVSPNLRGVALGGSVLLCVASKRA